MYVFQYVWRLRDASATCTEGTRRAEKSVLKAREEIDYPSYREMSYTEALKPD